MHDEQEAWTSSMDMLCDYQHEQHHGDAALKFSMNLQHGQAARVCSMESCHAAQPCKILNLQCFRGHSTLVSSFQVYNLSRSQSLETVFLK
jgi:hypothetical protein